jgi:hypothetical protein
MCALGVPSGRTTTQQLKQIHPRKETRHELEIMINLSKYLDSRLGQKSREMSLIRYSIANCNQLRSFLFYKNADLYTVSSSIWN